MPGGQVRRAKGVTFGDTFADAKHEMPKSQVKRGCGGPFYDDKSTARPDGRNQRGMKDGVAPGTVRGVNQDPDRTGVNAMQSFVSRHHHQIQGTLSGFDRLRFVGSLLRLSYVDGLAAFLGATGVLLKDFGDFMLKLSRRIKQAGEQIALGTPSGRVHYLPSGSRSKEDFVRGLPAPTRPDPSGLIAVLSCVEPCKTYEIHRDPRTKHLELQPALRKCLHYYFYLDHPIFGPMHLRLQTWIPFQVKIVLNGRDWLARQLDTAGIGYLKKDNTFVALDDFERAQALLDAQLQVNWPMALDELVSRFHPVHAEWMPATSPVNYYWSVEQSEWATDLVFSSSADLADLYPRLVHHGITTFGSRDVLRFLQQKVPAQGGVHGRFAGEVVSDLKHRPEGVRIKHAAGLNSVKLYDKQGQVLRVETTIHDASGLKVYRPAGDDPAGELKWQELRKGVADLHRRCELSQAANERYLEAMAAVESPTPLGELSGPLCHRMVKDGRRYRALNPLGDADARLLEFVARGEHLIAGFRNRDLRQWLYGDRSKDAAVHRRQSGRVGRLLALLRAHGLIQKIPKTHRYQVTTRGRERDRGDPGGASRRGGEVGRGRVRLRPKTLLENELKNPARRTGFSKLVVQRDQIEQVHPLANASYRASRDVGGEKEGLTQSPHPDLSAARGL